ncbi:MAG: hypothetical protein HY039_06755 [Nitrospirae bacterium]|nr:hypothetical protein [Nitrospirota bacterium]
MGFETFNPPASPEVTRTSSRAATPAASDPFSIRLASTGEEFEAAYALLAKAVRRAGRSGSHAARLKPTLHCGLPSTHTLLAWAEGQAAAAAVLVPDTPFGLPLDGVAAHCLRGLRDAGRRIAEVSHFVVHPECRHGGRDLPMRLYRTVFRLCREAGANDLLIRVSRRHRPFYEGVLLFQPLDCESHACPKTALRLDLETVEDRYARAYGRLDGPYNLHAFFTSGDERDETAGARPSAGLTKGLFEEFFVRRFGLLKEAGPDVVTYLRACYPGLRTASPRSRSPLLETLPAAARAGGIPEASLAVLARTLARELRQDGAKDLDFIVLATHLLRQIPDPESGSIP